MFINDVEEMVLNQRSEVYKAGMRRFRIEYGDDNGNYPFEGCVYIHKDTPDLLLRMRLICNILNGKEVDIEFDL